VTETTERVLGERRLKTLGALSTATADAATELGACELAGRVLADAAADLPFALLYLLDDDGRRARLATASGIDNGRSPSPAPQEILLDEPCLWPLATVARERSTAVVDGPFKPLPAFDGQAPCARAVVLPIERPGDARLAGFLVAGISPRLILDDNYNCFLDLVAGRIATALANVRALAESRARASPQAATVLLADDNADMRQYLTRILAARWNVISVADGASALAAARTHDPDLIVADIMMPGLDGFALLRELRTDDNLRLVPLIFLSARAGDEARVEGLHAGADDYLVKPFSARELTTRVSLHLELARLRAENGLTR
jgi:CheY-like chemotaxis protein